MQTQNLTAASRELFRRAPDECFGSLRELAAHCAAKRDESQDRWLAPATFSTSAGCHGLVCQTDDGGQYTLNDWSFGQLCRLSGVSKETVNRLSTETASRVLQETLPRHQTKPWQLLTRGASLRSVHGAAYTRLHDLELVELLARTAEGFVPPQQGMNGATGLYAGEQDLFCFLIDPAGWTEIEGEAFAPGMFVWNSEVGRRSLGIQTFWFQAVCQNHIVWDAVEIVEYTRKHTANVHDSLVEIRRIIERLVAKRDERKDAFARCMARAMRERLGNDAEETLEVLIKHGIPRGAAKEALRLAERQGRFTIFSLVDALTRLAGEIQYAGDRLEADLRAAQLLALAA